MAKEYVHLHSLVVSIYTQPSASAAPHLLNQLALYASTHRDLDSRLLQISPNNLVYIASYIARVLTMRLNKDILGSEKNCECIYTFSAVLHNQPRTALKISHHIGMCFSTRTFVLLKDSTSARPDPHFPRALGLASLFSVDPVCECELALHAAQADQSCSGCGSDHCRGDWTG